MITTTIDQCLADRANPEPLELWNAIRELRRQGMQVYRKDDQHASVDGNLLVPHAVVFLAQKAHTEIHQNPPSMISMG